MVCVYRYTYVQTKNIKTSVKTMYKKNNLPFAFNTWRSHNIIVHKNRLKSTDTAGSVYFNGTSFLLYRFFLFYGRNAPCARFCPGKWKYMPTGYNWLYQRILNVQVAMRKRMLFTQFLDLYFVLFFTSNVMWIMLFSEIFYSVEFTTSKKLVNWFLWGAILNWYALLWLNVLIFTLMINII